MPANEPPVSREAMLGAKFSMDTFFGLGLSINNSLLGNICMAGNIHKIVADTQKRHIDYRTEIKKPSGKPVGFAAIAALCPGRHEWIRTNDPYHVKVVL